MGIGLSNASHPKPRNIFATENDVTFSKKLQLPEDGEQQQDSLKLIKMRMQKTGAFLHGV